MVMAIIISFLGLFCGAALAMISPEELKPGKNYFRILQRAIIAAILVLLVVFKMNRLLLLALVLLFLLSYFLKNEKTLTQFHYLLFGFLVFLVSVPRFFPIFLSLIFIYGLPTGTLFVYTEKETRKAKLFSLLFLEYLHYLVLGLGLTIIFK